MRAGPIVVHGVRPWGEAKGQWFPKWDPLDVHGLQSPSAPTNMANGQGWWGL